MKLTSERDRINVVYFHLHPGKIYLDCVCCAFVLSVLCEIILLDLVALHEIRLCRVDQMYLFFSDDVTY